MRVLETVIFLSLGALKFIDFHQTGRASQALIALGFVLVAVTVICSAAPPLKFNEKLTLKSLFSGTKEKPWVNLLSFFSLSLLVAGYYGQLSESF